MKMMQKMNPLTLIICAISTVAHADDQSRGAASAKLTVNANQEWAIAKKQDGVLNIDASGRLTKLPASGHREGRWPVLKVTNLTGTAGEFYLAGSGSSQGLDGNILMVNTDAAMDDPAHRTYLVAFAGDSRLTWIAVVKKWQGPSIAAGTAQDITLVPVADSPPTPAGTYTSLSIDFLLFISGAGPFQISERYPASRSADHFRF